MNHAKCGLLVYASVCLSTCNSLSASTRPADAVVFEKRLSRDTSLVVVQSETVLKPVSSDGNAVEAQQSLPGRRYSFLVGTGDGDRRVAGTIVTTLYAGHGSRVLDAAVYGDETLVVLASADGWVRCYLLPLHADDAPRQRLDIIQLNMESGPAVETGSITREDQNPSAFLIAVGFRAEADQAPTWRNYQLRKGDKGRWRCFTPDGEPVVQRVKEVLTGGQATHYRLED